MPAPGVFVIARIGGAACDLDHECMIVKDVRDRWSFGFHKTGKTREVHIATISGVSIVVATGTRSPIRANLAPRLGWCGFLEICRGPVALDEIEAAAVQFLSVSGTDAALAARRVFLFLAPQFAPAENSWGTPAAASAADCDEDAVGREVDCSRGTSRPLGAMADMPGARPCCGSASASTWRPRQSLPPQKPPAGASQTTLPRLRACPDLDWKTLSGLDMPVATYARALKDLERRMTMGKVPVFDPNVARGTPALWNKVNTFGWGWNAKRYFPKKEGAAAPRVEINDFLGFLDKRLGQDGQPVSHKLGVPEPHPDGWWRLPWKAFDEAALPKEPLGEWETEAIWMRAWHGTKIEALFSIMYHGRLAASQDTESGDRFFEGKPGVYVHKDETGEKAEYYSRFIPLRRDGVFWSVKWEVMVDRSDRVPLRKIGTDQWAQNSRSVRLVALWVCGRTHDSMKDGLSIAECWRPELEANPVSIPEHRLEFVCTALGSTWTDEPKDRMTEDDGDDASSSQPKERGRSRGSPPR